mmetsp:Transcript_28626/g.44841  ORF Transcript_28626/g.44841 Transcript_28626/m.44841 type:complete len:112 (-) Transcript_28626:256-591(-)
MDEDNGWVVLEGASPARSKSCDTPAKVRIGMLDGLVRVSIMPSEDSESAEFRTSLSEEEMREMMDINQSNPTFSGPKNWLGVGEPTPSKPHRPDDWGQAIDGSDLMLQVRV